MHMVLEQLMEEEKQTCRAYFAQRFSIKLFAKIWFCGVIFHYCKCETQKRD